MLKKNKEGENYFSPIVDLEIVDKGGDAVGVDEMGAVRVYSKYICSEYNGSLMQPDEIRPYTTNDLGVLGEDGLLRLIGRIDDVINEGGVKFSPEVVEAKFIRHIQIKDAGVVSVRSASDSNEVWLAVVTDHAMNAEALITWYRQNSMGELRGIIFDKVFLVEQIPRGLNGKVLRAKLREELISLENMMDRRQN